MTDSTPERYALVLERREERLLRKAISLRTERIRYQNALALIADLKGRTRELEALLKHERIVKERLLEDIKRLTEQIERMARHNQDLGEILAKAQARPWNRLRGY